MEVPPPLQAWDKLSAKLNEINTDAVVASKMLQAELTPPAGVWENIKNSFLIEEKPGTEKKTVIINLKKLAVAAIFIGLMATAWLLFFNQPKETNNIATTHTTEQTPSILSEKKEPDSENGGSEPKAIISDIATVTPIKKNQTKKTAYSIPSAFVQTKHFIPPAEMDNNPSLAIQKEVPGNKLFDQPIDDLSMIAANEHYMTMVNANGRMVKIPAHLAHLAPRLQDKPITEDYFEILYGEGAFWKDKLNTWRQKLATSPVASGDIFSNMVELLKSMDSQQDDPNGKGR